MKNVQSIPFYQEWQMYQEKGVISNTVRGPIRESWEEAKQLGLKADEPPRIIYLNDSQFEVILEPSRRLIATVNQKIELMTSKIGYDIHYPIFLFNSQGILLYVANSSSTFCSDVIKPGLMASFPLLANTAVSQALKTKSSQIVTGAEHYFSKLHPYITLASPIYHPASQECSGVLATIIDHQDAFLSKLALLNCLAMLVEESIRLENAHSRILRIHYETKNLIDHYILVVDSKGTIIDSNEAIENLFPDDELIGRPAMEVFARNFDYDSITSLPLYRAIYFEEECTNQELWVKMRRTGKKLCLLVDSKIIYDPFESGAFWVIHIFKDITEKKLNELQLLQREKMVSLGTLAAGLAHEIRNPLTTAKGFIQLLGENSPNKEAFGLIQNELNRITQLVNQFVLLSKPDSPQMRPISVNTMLRDFTTFIQPEAMLTGIEILTKLCAPDVTIMADKNQLTQVFINLAQNAFSAMDSSSEKRLTIEADIADDQRIEIKFIDTGCGIPVHLLDKIVDPFFTTNEKGTGLGLPICFQIVEAHHGELLIDSEVNIGTTVTIRLPLF